MDAKRPETGSREEADFYDRLPVFDHFSQLTDPELYMPAPDDWGSTRTPSWASVRECPLSPTGSFRPYRVTIEWRQK